MIPADEPLPDPVAFARSLSEEELQDYREIYGEDSREWIIAQRERSRRRWPAWRRILYFLVLAASIGMLVFSIAQ